MKTLSCLIVDDEAFARKGIALHAAEMKNLKIVGECINAIKANEFLLDNDVDLIFLDIEMPGLNGLDFIKGLKKDVMIILTTAYPEYALESYELEVVDYLVKPIRFERFYKAVNKANQLLELKQNKTEITDLDEEFFYIKADRKFVKMTYSDIRYIKGVKDYVMIVTDNKPYLTAMNVKTIFSKLPHNQFARISRSFIVNIQYIESIDTDHVYIGEEEIPMGKSYKEEFIQKFVKGKLFKR